MFFCSTRTKNFNQDLLFFRLIHRLSLRKYRNVGFVIRSSMVLLFISSRRHTLRFNRFGEKYRFSLELKGLIHNARMRQALAPWASYILARHFGIKRRHLLSHNDLFLSPVDFFSFSVAENNFRSCECSHYSIPY